MNKEEELFKNRLIDLGDSAYQKNKVSFTEFLNLNELNIFYSSLKDLAFIKWEIFGGYETAERQMVAFLPDALYYEWNYPISCIKIAPLSVRYMQPLSHRDYLGAVINLGLERRRIGDIVIQDNNALLFCVESLSDFIINELTRVKHTSVICTKIVPEELHVVPDTLQIKGSIASARLDSLLALVYTGSRSSLTSLIEGGKVFVNGKLITSNGYSVKEDDIISVRKMGRFRYMGIVSQSKKGRNIVKIDKYI